MQRFLRHGSNPNFEVMRTRVALYKSPETDLHHGGTSLDIRASLECLSNIHIFERACVLAL